MLKNNPRVAGQLPQVYSLDCAGERRLNGFGRQNINARTTIYTFQTRASRPLRLSPCSLLAPLLVLDERRGAARRYLVRITHTRFARLRVGRDGDDASLSK